MTTNILALDTSTENCSVALMFNGKLFTRSEVAPRDHTKKILPMVDEVLTEAGVKLTDLDAIAFGQGPGSFTGVRIGIGIAQGLAFGADLPMIGISTLEAMAQASFRLYQAEHVACAIDARMSEIYWGQYQRQSDGTWLAMPLKNGQQECVIPPEVLDNELNDEANGSQYMRAGTGWDAYAESLNLTRIKLSESQLLQDQLLQGQASQVLYPEAQDMLVLAQLQFVLGNMVAVEDSQPTYLRDKVTWKKLPGRE